VITPNVGKILVKFDTDSDKTDGGLYIPASAERSVEPKRATVVISGPFKKVDGQEVSIGFYTGDRVILDPLGGVKLRLDGVEMALVRAEDVLARIDK
jgi:co-chaperonin GroES (HSP10)